MPAPFAAQHDTMVSLAEGIIAAARRGTPEAMRDLTQKRLALSKCVSDHCAAEIAEINRTGRQDNAVPDGDVLMRRYHDELLVWRRSLMECNAQWPASRVAQDADEFVASFRPIARQLSERVRWEEEVFYPAVFGRTVGALRRAG